MFLRSFFAWLCLAVTALAVEPKAVIVGPDTVAPGDLAVLSAKGSAYDGQLIAWCLDSPKQFIAWGDSAAFASGTPGRYTFTLFVAGLSTDQKSMQTATAQKTITVGQPGPGPNPPVPPGPGPTPPGPTPGPDRFGLTAAVSALAAKVDASARAIAPALAANFEAIAAQIQAGTLTTMDAVRQATLDRNRASEGEQATLWAPFFFSLNTSVNQLIDAGKLTSIQDVRDAWLAIAAGLRTVQR
jgi:hypothetical protein